MPLTGGLSPHQTWGSLGPSSVTFAPALDRDVPAAERSSQVACVCTWWRSLGQGPPQRTGRGVGGEHGAGPARPARPPPRAGPARRQGRPGLLQARAGPWQGRVIPRRHPGQPPGRASPPPAETLGGCPAGTPVDNGSRRHLVWPWDMPLSSVCSLPPPTWVVLGQITVIIASASLKKDFVYFF